ncbi:MAG: hypothetical protein ABI852_16785 [Gemmatimonadaceae bacterium]
MLKFLSGELKGDTNEPDSPIRSEPAVDASANGNACALNGSLYGLNSEVCWGHVKLRCDPQGWVRMGECGHIEIKS